MTHNNFTFYTAGHSIGIQCDDILVMALMYYSRSCYDLVLYNVWSKDVQITGVDEI
jgi:hypothetical protein